MGWLTTHGVRPGDGKCELGSCLDLFSRTEKHVPLVSPGILGIRQVLGQTKPLVPISLFS